MKRAEINEILNGKTIEKINETKNWLFEIYISKIDKPPAKLTKKKVRRNKSPISRMNKKISLQTLPNIKTIIRKL